MDKFWTQKSGKIIESCNILESGNFFKKFN